MRSKSSRAVWRLSTLIVVVGAFAVRFGCSYDPHFQSGVTRCAAGDVTKRCPDGYVCDETSGSGFCITAVTGGGSGAGGAGIAGQTGTGGASGTGGVSGGGAGGKAATGGVSGTGGAAGGGMGGASGTGGNVGIGGMGAGGMGAGGTPATGGMSGGTGGAGGATVAIVTFTIPTASSRPFQITRGPDNNLWFTEAAASKIARCTPSGVVTEFKTTTAGAGPLDIISAGGFLWFIEGNLNKIGKCDTSGNMLAEFPITLGASSTTTWLAAGPDGNIWYTDSSNNRVGRMTLAGVSTTFAAAANSTPLRITAGPDGNLWFTEFTGSRVSKLTTAGVITGYTTPTAKAFPVAIASDGTTGLIFLEASKVGRITAATAQFQPEYPVPAGVLNDVGGNVVLALEGNFWFTNGTDSIVRMTPGGTMTRYTVPGNNQLASGLVLGPDGNMWFVDNAQNFIGRITP